MIDQETLGKIDALMDMVQSQQGQIDGLLCIVSDLEGRLTLLERGKAPSRCTVCDAVAPSGSDLCRFCALKLANRVLADPQGGKVS